MPSEQALRVTGLGTLVKVRWHAAARRLTLRVSQTRRAVIVTMPQHSSLDDADRFVAKHIDWVKQRLDAMPQPVPFADGVVIPYRGTPHLIRFAGPSRGKSVVTIANVKAAREAQREAKDRGIAKWRQKPDEKYLPHLVVRGHAEHAPRRLRDWLVGEAKARIVERVDFHAERLGLKYRQVAMRDQTSRWGSCSSSRVLSFSWRLILAPAFVLDYVAAHEVAHLKEMNHGPRYWALLARTYPDLEEARRWLHREGASLHAYGRED
ncbi:MAG: SprT family zinc-dependent metalloprotease [Hyphomicrobiaceae bacterium]